MKVPALPQVDVPVPAPDAGNIIERLTAQSWFYPGVAAAIIAALLLMIWGKVPAQLRWLTLGVILTAGAILVVGIGQ